MIELKWTYRMPIGIWIIRNSRYIASCLSGLIQEMFFKKKLYSTSSKKQYIDEDDKTDHCIVHSQLKNSDYNDFFNRKGLLMNWKLFWLEHQ